MTSARQPRILRFTRLADLGDALAGIVGRRDPATLFRQELILVDGKAMSNWLSRHLILDARLPGSDRPGLGIHMRADLLNFQRLAPRLAATIENVPAAKRLKDPMADLKVRIHRLLSEKGSQHAKAFEAEMGDPATDGGQVRWELAGRLADWLRELALDDPEWVAGAEKKGAGGRLEALWRDIRASLGKADALVTPADVVRRLASDPAARQRVADSVPGRLTLVAVGNVPRSVLLALDALRGDIEIHALCLQPSLGYHLDLDWDLREGAPSTPGETLLRQTARHYRAQLGKFLELEGWEPGGEESDAGSEAAPTLLEGLRRSMETFESPVSAPSDGSVAIHRCHTHQREVEVLRDEILAAMKADPTLKPRDFLVLSPDPETYRPLLEGVLRERQPIIPVSTVAIEGPRKSPLAALAETLLELPKGRFTAPEVLAFCELAVVRDRFGWDSGDLATIRGWFEAGPFLWGTDASHRDQLVGTAFAEWSLDDFRRRLVLGTAVTGEEGLAGDPGTLPLTDIEGRQDMRLAGQLLDLLGALQAWAISARGEHTLTRWAADFAGLMKDVLPEGRDYQKETGQLEGALGALTEAAGRGTADPVPLRLFASLALSHLDLDFGKGQFFAGGVTLAPLKSGNIHPAKVICLLGMHDGAFPPRGTSPGPELRTEVPCKATRFREQSEQRGMHAILLAIVAAERRLLATFRGYAGAAGKDAGAALPIELLKHACEQLTGGRKSGFRITRHALHAHEAAHGSKDERAGEPTFDRAAAAAARAIGEGRAAPEVTVGDVLRFDSWGLDEWVEFWDRPVYGALNGLDARTAYVEGELAHEEPLYTDTEDYRANTARARWHEAYVRRTGAKPDMEAALLSGLFANDMAGAKVLAELNSLEVVETGDEAVDELETALEAATGIALASWTELKGVTSRHYAKFLAHGPLLALLPREQRLLEENHLISGIAALSYLKGSHADLRHVIVLGYEQVKDKRTKEEKAANVPRDMTLVVKCLMAYDHEDLDAATGRARLQELGRAAISHRFFLGKKLLEAATKRALYRELSAARNADGNFRTFDPDDRPRAANGTELDGKPPYSKGDRHYKGSSLLLPPSFDFEALDTAVRKAFGAYERLTDSNVPKAVPTALGIEPATPTKAKGKQGEKPAAKGKTKGK